jgi:hypothetical protein
MQEDNNNSLPAHITTAAGARPIRWESGMLDNWLIDADTFASITFLGATERKEFVEDKNIPYNNRPQKRNKDNVPVWTVTLAVADWRGRGTVMKLNMPSPQNPADSIGAGEKVELVRPVAGVTPKREGNGYIVWMTADDIKSVDVAAKRPAAVA